MNIADKLLLIAENEQKLYDKGFADGKTNGGIEIEMTSTVSNAAQLKNILFADIPTNNICAACLTKPKNDMLVNNQIYFLYQTEPVQQGARVRDGVFADIPLQSSYDASITIGDIYTVYDFGEVQYVN